MNTLVVMRHGQAEAVADCDRNRQLTDHGVNQCSAAAKALLENMSGVLSTKAIYHSPYIRTTQTAKHLQVGLQSHSHSENTDTIATIPSNALLGDNTAEAVVEWLSALPAREQQCGVVVSHQPLVSNLLAWLIEGAGQRDYAVHSRYPMQTASLAIVDYEVLGRGTAQLRCLIHRDH